MQKLVLIFIILLLSSFVLYTAVKIEILNAHAGNYLPRHDRQPDGTFADGKWRASLENTPRDQLRKAVQTFGIVQYLIAPLLFAVAAFVALKSKVRCARIAGATGVFVAAVALWLMFYREYWSSLAG